MNNLILRIISPDQSTKNIHLYRLMSVRTQPGTQYMLVDKSTGELISDVVSKRSGNSLVVEHNGRKVLYLNKYYANGTEQASFVTDQVTMSSPAPEPVAVDPVVEPTAATTGREISPHTTSSASSSGAVAGGGSFWAQNSSLILLGGAAVAGAAAVAASGGGGGGDDDDEPQPGTDTTAPVFNNGNAATLTLTDGSQAGSEIYNPVVTDDSTIQYRLKNTADAASFSVDANTGKVTLAETVDRTSQTEYQFTVIATDEAGNNSEQTVTVTVNPATTAATITTVDIVSDSEPVYEVLNTGDTITAQVSFSDLVTVAGSPTLSLSIGNQIVEADYKSGTGTQVLMFSYTLPASVNDVDGISIVADSLNLNGGSLKDSNSNNVTLTHAAVASNSAFRVDTDPPTFVSGTTVSNIDDGTSPGTLIYTPTVSDQTDISYTLKSGADANAFNINNRSGAMTLAEEANHADQSSYQFTVIATDAAGNSSEQTINLGINPPPTTPAELTSVAIVSDSETEYDILNAGDTVNALVTFSDTVTVTGTPTLMLNIGAQAVAATYKSGSDSPSLLFSTTVQSSQTDTDGISIDANSLSLNGTIQDSNGHDVVLSHAAVAANASFTVDTQAPAFNSGSTANDIDNGTASGTEVYNASASDSNTVSYRLKPTLDFEAFEIESSTGRVTLAETAEHASQSSYAFTVVATDAAGNSSEQQISLSVTPPATTTGINNVEITSSETDFEALNSGDTVNIEVTWSDDVLVTGTPTMSLTIGNQTVSAEYTSGTGSQTLVFSTTIQAAHTDSDGISIDANRLNLNGGTIKDSNGNDATLEHTAVTSTIMVDSVSPSVQLLNPVPIQLGSPNETDGPDYSPQITAVGNNGDYVVVWRAEDQAGGKENDHSVLLQKFDANGQAITSATKFAALGLPFSVDFKPGITTLGDSGEFVMSWVTFDQDDNRFIQVQKFDSLGNTMGDTVELPSLINQFGPNYSPKVSPVGSNGAFIVAWDQLDAPWPTLTETSPTSIVVQAFDANGAVSGDLQTFRMPNVDDSNNYEADVTAILANGTAVVTWNAFDSEQKASVLMQRFDSNGHALGDTMQIDGSTTNRGDWPPQITEIGSNGDYIVAWSGVDGEGDYSIFVQQFNREGVKTFDNPIQLEGLNNTSGTDLAPDITALADNHGYVIAWTGQSSSDQKSVFVQKLDVDGNLIGNTVQLNPNLGNSVDANLVKVSGIDNQGDYVVAWQDRDFEGGISIYVQQFNADGTTTGHEQIKLQAPRNNTGDDILVDIAAIGNDGGYAVTWQGVD